MNDIIKVVGLAGLGFVILGIITGFGVLMLERMKNASGISGTSAFNILNTSQRLVGSIVTDWGDILLLLVIFLVLIGGIAAIWAISRGAFGGGAGGR